MSRAAHGSGMFVSVWGQKTERRIEGSKLKQVLERLQRSNFFASGDWLVKCTWRAHELPRFFVRRGCPNETLHRSDLTGRLSLMSS